MFLGFHNNFRLAVLISFVLIKIKKIKSVSQEGSTQPVVHYCRGPTKGLGATDKWMMVTRFEPTSGLHSVRWTFPFEFKVG